MVDSATVQVQPYTPRPGSSGASEVLILWSDGRREQIRQRDLTVEVWSEAADGPPAPVRYRVYLHIRRHDNTLHCLGSGNGSDDTPQAAVRALWRSPLACPLRVRFSVPGSGRPMRTFTEAMRLVIYNLAETWDARTFARYQNVAVHLDRINCPIDQPWGPAWHETARAGA